MTAMIQAFLSPLTRNTETPIRMNPVMKTIQVDAWIPSSDSMFWMTWSRSGMAGVTNFPFVLLGRALLHHKLVSKRTHAAQEKIILLSYNGQNAKDQQAPEFEEPEQERY